MHLENWRVNYLNLKIKLASNFMKVVFEATDKVEEPKYSM